ncbi:MAG TPA: gluconate 2-dehydrogenase subunit 3 family protein [Gemmatimonadaceae bacterium]
MRRREAVQFLGAALALQLIPRNAQSAIELGEQIHRRLGDVPFRTLNPDQRRVVTQIAEMIIPETDTPGATSVKVPEFIDLILTEWATEEEKAAFLAGLSDIDVQAAAMGSPRFLDLAEAKRGEFLTGLDAKRPAKAGAAHAFERIKALTVYGYFTSEVVQTDILKTQMFFNGYDGNVPFTPRV